MDKVTFTFDTLPQAVTELYSKLTNIENLLNRQNKEHYKPKDEMLTIQQAAEFLHLSVPTIYGKVSKNEIPVMKRSKRLYFSESELTDYLKQGRQKTISEIAGEVDSFLELPHKRKNSK